MPATMKEVTSETRTLHLLTSDIVEITYHADVVITIELAKEDMRIYEQFTENKPYKKLVTGRAFKIDVEVRKFIAAENTKRKHLIIAEAIVASSSLGKAVSYLYLFFQNQAYPCKVFSTRDKALKWLTEQ